MCGKEYENLRKYTDMVDDYIRGDTCIKLSKLKGDLIKAYRKGKLSSVQYLWLTNRLKGESCSDRYL